MAKYIGPRGKIARRFGEAVRGCAKVLKNKNYPPGEHGQKRKKRSQYAMQLIEKQKTKHRYGYLEKQFRNLVKKVIVQKGSSGELLLQKLELGLANVVYRLGIAPTVAAARQLVVHRHILVNGHRVDRPSYSLQKGDRVSLSTKARTFDVIKNSLANQRAYPWLAWDEKTQQGSVLDVPSTKSIPEQINPNTIIEFYAR